MGYELPVGKTPHSARTSSGLYYASMKTHQLRLAQRILLSLLATALLVIAGVGCNTAHGFGKDVSNTGDSIQRGTK